MERRSRTAFEAEEGKYDYVRDSSVFFGAYGVDADYKPPMRTSPGAAGYDIFALEEFSIPPFSMVTVPTNIVVCNDINVWYKIADRSSVALMGVSVVAGVIDCDFTNDVCVMLRNFNSYAVSFVKGEAIAQIIPIPRVLSL